ncbi:MAG: hypothetical protein EON54_26840 [Alcaligenaceae bacterium]|nr:MAG: hypothetical protein EON54_26840 [Alcaligenaceae bacterium]
MPEQVRAIWRKSAIATGYKNEHYYPDEIVGDEILEVGSRIPQDLVDDLRRDRRGSLRLKFRMSEEGTMFGWDIERRPGYDPKILDSYRLPAYVAPVHSFAGGDFREAQIYNGKPVRLGWYIDRQTGKKIETDY